MSSQSSQPALAFLGPEGTYSHQVAYDAYGSSVQYCEKKTITDVFNAVSSEVPFGMIPQENSIFGSVIETYNLLRQPKMGQDIFVRGEATLGVKHCLLVRKGVKLEQIRRVLSHEQALGQCSRFIAQSIPGAVLEKVPSTAAAAQMLSTPGGLDNSTECAAICSRLCVTVFDGLEVLHEGIQDEDVNFTRFYLLGWGTIRALPVPRNNSEPRRALIRIAARPLPPSSPSGVGRILADLRLSVTRIDRRPSLSKEPFEDVYFIEVQDSKPVAEARDERRDAEWLEEVEGEVRRIREVGAQAEALGAW
ncbi:hypothetical protein PLICRDRAFT_152397 [Plicaturopsis crispa FD-325 SS-3]|nr:hypothetical protein PLICRDRAFT_152397 [Plicaturopsis crispa FD-325 SS-3]